MIFLLHRDFQRELVKELTDLDVGRVPLSVEDILHEVVALQVSLPGYYVDLRETMHQILQRFIFFLFAK